MLVSVNANANNNKFYEVTLGDDDRVVTRWGRVGTSGTITPKGVGRTAYERVIREKTRKGYQEVDVVSAPTKAAGDNNLREVSRKNLAGDAADPILLDLIDRLVALNAHEIVKQSGGRIQVKDGQVTTPLGLLSKSALNRALRLLDAIQDETNRAAKVRLLEDYLTLVPQKVASKRGWEDGLLTPGALSDQRTFVSQLSDSLDFALSHPNDTATKDEPVENPFKMRLSVLDPTDREFARIRAMFEKSRNAQHRASYGYRLKRVYVLHDDAQKKLFEAAATIGNISQLWHGTRAINVLSILSKGLYCPPASSRFVTGRMFGNGVYFSNQSTKSLNYSVGVWGGGVSGRDKSCYMMLADVAMGHEFRPTSSHQDWNAIHSGRVTDNGKRYHSVNVKPGTANVLNHEAIVWNTDQIMLRHLCEFEA